LVNTSPILKPVRTIKSNDFNLISKD
jgi:hypothetical protein